MQQSTSPFRDTQAGNIIADFAFKELFPLKRDLVKFSGDLASFVPGLLEPILRKKFGQLEADYVTLSKRFSEVVEKAETPDELFSDLQGQANPNTTIATYFQCKPAIDKELDSLVRLRTYIDALIATKRNQLDFRSSVALSVIAIVIAVAIGVGSFVFA